MDLVPGLLVLLIFLAYNLDLCLLFLVFLAHDLALVVLYKPWSLG